MDLVAAFCLLPCLSIAVAAIARAMTTPATPAADAFLDLTSSGHERNHERLLYTPDWAKPLPVGPPPLCSEQARLVARLCQPMRSLQHWKDRCWVPQWRRTGGTLHSPIAELNLFRWLHPPFLPNETPPDRHAPLNWQPAGPSPRLRYTHAEYFDFFGHTEEHIGKCPFETYCHPVYNGIALMECRPTVFLWPASALGEQSREQLVYGRARSELPRKRKRPVEAFAGDFSITPAAESSKSAASCPPLPPWPSTGRYFTGESSSSASRRQVCRRVEVDEDIPSAALSAMLIDDSHTHTVRAVDGVGMAVAVNDRITPVCTNAEEEAICEPSTTVDLATGDTVEFMVDVDMSDLPAVFHFDIDPTKPS